MDETDGDFKLSLPQMIRASKILLHKINILG